MKKLQLILPMLAFIFAIGMSFAFVEATAEDYYATGFIELDDTWYEVDVDCETGSNDCEAEIQGEPGETYPVHTQPSTTSPLLESPTQDSKVIPDPRL